MVAKRGSDLLLKLNADGTGMQTVAGLRSKQISLNAGTVDITDSESAGRWRELLAGAGVRRASLSGSGIFKDNQSDEQTRAVFFGGHIVPWQIMVPGFGSLEGLFQITALEYSAQHDGEISFEIALESAGEISFEALS